LPRKRQRELNLGPWIIGIVVAAVIAAAIYWWLGRVPAPADISPLPASGTRLELPVPAEPPPAEQGPETAVADAPDDTSVLDATDSLAPATAEVRDAPEPATAAAARPASPTDGPQVRLAMTFSGDCWTEVSDAAGTRLFFDLGSAGRTVNVSGSPPLRVLFGNSENVTVAVDGRDYPITAAMRRGQTARLTINKP
jgi:cytoskeleton protein RodZ